MKRDILLLIDTDADTADVVCSAAALSRFDVRLALRLSDSFQVIEHGVRDVDLIVIDVDPGLDGMDVLDALDAYDLRVPVIIISSSEQAHLHPAATHETRVCLRKPTSIERLSAAISMFARTPGEQGCRCDTWDHPYQDCPSRIQRAATAQLLGLPKMARASRSTNFAGGR